MNIMPTSVHLPIFLALELPFYHFLPMKHMANGKSVTCSTRSREALRKKRSREADTIQYYFFVAFFLASVFFCRFLKIIDAV